MKELLKQLINKWTCHHEWEKWDMVHVYTDLGSSYDVTHFVCKKCGKFKKVKVINMKRKLGYRVTNFIGLYPIFIIEDISKVTLEFIESRYCGKVKVNNQIGYLYPSQYEKYSTRNWRNNTNKQ